MDSADILDITDGDGGLHRLWMHKRGDKPKGGWQTLLALDGNRMFPLACAAAEHAPTPLLIVGIGYPSDDRRNIVQRRYWDLASRAPPERIPMRDPTLRIETGGCEAYLGFLESAVLPAIARRHDLGATTLFGHSLGGYFAIRALLSDGFPATRYVAADPSVWWNSHELMGHAHAFRAAASSALTEPPKHLAILTAGTSADRPGLSEDEKQAIAAIRGGPNGMDLHAALEGDPRLVATASRLEAETHGSIIVPALEAAVTFAAGE